LATTLEFVMSAARSILLLSRPSSFGYALSLRPLLKNLRRFATGVPESIKRVGEAAAFPNEYPGHNYDFNWALNFDGVTPLKKCSFRIMKPLDLKIAGLDPINIPLEVDTAAEKGLIPEAGSDSLSFASFDEVLQRAKDLLSLSDTLYCPEGHIPSTFTGSRIITNSANLAPKLLAYLERMPRRDPTAQPITAYVLEETKTEEDFSGYAIEEVEDTITGEVKSVASVVVVGKQTKIETIVSALELCVGGLLEDEESRKREAEEKDVASEKER